MESSAYPEQEVERLGKLAALLHHRWSLPILVELDRAAGAKFITLLNRLQLSRDSLTRTLKVLIEQGWVEKNPGHGHPMRPEYILTSKAIGITPSCAEILDELRSLDLEILGLRKWTLPTLLALGKSGMRFSDLKGKLAGITPRALTETLKALAEVSMIKRVVLDTYPPSVEYQIGKKSKPLYELLDELSEKMVELE